jgi:hypothetical protein
MLGCTTEELHFLWTKVLNAKDIHKEMFPVYGGKCFSCKAVHSWVKKFSRMLDQVILLRRDKSNCAVGGRVDLSRQEDNSRQCSNCTRVLPWFSIQHNA